MYPSPLEIELRDVYNSLLKPYWQVLDKPSKYYKKLPPSKELYRVFSLRPKSANAMFQGTSLDRFLDPRIEQIASSQSDNIQLRFGSDRRSGIIFFLEDNNQSLPLSETVFASMTWIIEPREYVNTYKVLKRAEDNSGVEVCPIKELTSTVPDFIVTAGLTNAVNKNRGVEGDRRFDYGKVIAANGGYLFFDKPLRVFHRHAPENTWFLAGAQGRIPYMSFRKLEEAIDTPERTSFSWKELNDMIDDPRTQIGPDDFGKPRDVSRPTFNKYTKMGVPRYLDYALFPSMGPVFAYQMK